MWLLEWSTGCGSSQTAQNPSGWSAQRFQVLGSDRELFSSVFVQTSVNKCFKQSPGKCLLLVSKAALRADSCPLLVTDCHQESSASMENPESLELGTSTQSTSSVCSAERTTNSCFLQQKEEEGRGVNSGICNVGYSPSSATGVALDVT